MQQRRRQQVVEWVAAAAVAALLLQLSNLVVPPPAVVPDGQPSFFVDQSRAPFAFDGKFPHRILWPLLAHVAGHCGITPIAFSQLCGGALLAVVCWFCRQRGVAWIDAVLVTATVAASGAVLVYRPMPCMADPLNLLLLVLTVHFVAYRGVYWVLVLLAATSHEMVFLFAPWLLWLRRRAGGSWRGDGAALVAVLAAYGAWRWTVKALLPATAPAVSYDGLFYVLSNFWVPHGMPAMWLLWAFVVVAEFGPLLVLVGIVGRRPDPWLGGGLGGWLYLAGILALMLLAYDVFRFASFVFLPVVLGGIALVRRPGGRLWLAGLLAAAVVVYRWQHPIPSEQGGRTFTDITGHVQELLLAWLRSQPAGPRFTLGEGMRFTADLLARTWPAFVTAGAAGVVAIAVGRWLGSRGDEGPAAKGR